MEFLEGQLQCYIRKGKTSQNGNPFFPLNKLEKKNRLTPNIVTLIKIEEEFNKIEKRKIMEKINEFNIFL